MLRPFAQHGAAPLHWAASNGHETVVGLLLKAKAHTNLCDNDGCGHRFGPCKQHHLRVVCARGCTLTSWCRRFSLGCVRFRLCWDAPRDVVRYTPLHLAALDGHVAPVTLLIDARDSNLTNKTNDGNTALHLSASMGHAIVVETLLAAKADVNDDNNDGETSLHLALRHEQDLVADLLRAASKLSAAAAGGSTPSKSVRSVAIPGGYDSPPLVRTQSLTLPGIVACVRERKLSGGHGPLKRRMKRASPLQGLSPRRRCGIDGDAAQNSATVQNSSV